MFIVFQQEINPTATVLMTKWEDSIKMGLSPQHQVVSGANEVLTAPVLEVKRRFVKSSDNVITDQPFSRELDQVLAALFDSGEENVSEEEFRRQMKTVFVPKDSSLGVVPELNPSVHASLLTDGCKFLKFTCEFMYGINRVDYVWNSAVNLCIELFLNLQVGTGTLSFKVHSSACC